MAADSLLVFVILIVLQTTVDGDICLGRRNGDSYYMYCHDGCCGSYYNRECCSASFNTIVGAVVGCLICIGIIVAVVIVIVCYKKKQSPGVIHALPINQGYVGQPIPPPSYPGQPYPPPPSYHNEPYPPNSANTSAPYPPPPPHRY